MATGTELPMSQKSHGEAPSSSIRKILIRPVFLPGSPSDSEATTSGFSPSHCSQTTLEESKSDDGNDPIELESQRSWRRQSLAISSLATIRICKYHLDPRFVVSPTYPLSSFDCSVYKIDKEYYFIHESVLTPAIVLARVSRSSRGMLSGSSWQIYAGKNELVGIIKYGITSSLNSIFTVASCTAAGQETTIYSLLRKLRSSKVGIYFGDNTKEQSKLKAFCLISSDRVYIKLRDRNPRVETLGSTIVDWRQHNGILRIGRGFDFLLAVACFCVADMCEALYCAPLLSNLPVISEQIRKSLPGDYRAIMGW